MKGNGSAWRIGQEKILTRDQVSQVLREAKVYGRTYYILFAIAANAGLRLSELVHLRVADYQAGQLTVVRRRRKGLAPESIDLSGPVSRLIERHVVSQGMKFSGWMFEGHSGSCRRGKDWLCHGGHVSRREVQRRWKAILRSCGLLKRGRGIHSLRHYAIATFHETHRDSRATQKFAGLSSISTVLSYDDLLDLKEKIRKVKATV